MANYLTVPSRDCQGKRTVFVSELHVDPAEQKQGIGRKLLQMAGEAGLHPLSPRGEVSGSNMS